MCVLTGIRFSYAMLRMGRQQVEQIATTTQFRNDKQFVIHTKDIVQSNNVVVPSKLSQHIYFLLQLANVLVIITQQDALAGKLFALTAAVHMTFWLTAACDTYLTV